MPPKSSSKSKSSTSTSRPSTSASTSQPPSSPAVPWENPPPSFHLRQLDHHLHRIHFALQTGQNVPEHEGGYWAPVFADLYPDLVALREALRRYSGVPDIVRQMLAAACIVAYAGGFDDEDWAIDHDEAIEIAYSNSPIFDVMQEPMRSSYLQPHVLHVTFNRLSTARPILDEYFPNAEAGPSQPSAVARRSPVLERDPSSSPPSAPPAKRVRLRSPSPDDEDLFHPSATSRAPPEEPPVTRSQGKRKAASQDKSKAPAKPSAEKNKSKGKGKAKAKIPTVPLHRAYVLVPPFHSTVVGKPPQKKKAPRVVPSEEERSAGILPFVKGTQLSLAGPDGLEPLSFDRLMRIQALSDPYLPGSWCSYCIARRLPDCIPEYHHKKGHSSPTPPIRCNNCRKADQRCSFSYGAPINEQWRTMQLSVGARQPQLIRHAFINLESLVQTHNEAVADAHRRMEQALQLRPIIEAQQRLFRMVGGDPKLLLGMLSHDRPDGSLTPNEAAMVAAVMGWDTVPSVAGLSVKAAGGHYFLYDADRNLVASTELADETPEELSEAHAALRSSFQPPISVHDSSPAASPLRAPSPSVRHLAPSPSPTVSDHLLSRGVSLSLPSPVTDDQRMVNLEAQEVPDGEESASEVGDKDKMDVDNDLDADGDADEDFEASVLQSATHVAPTPQVDTPVSPAAVVDEPAQAPSPPTSTVHVQSAPLPSPSTPAAAGASINAPLPSDEASADEVPALSHSQRKNKRKRQNRKNRKARERQEGGGNA
ncbi:hypothetical protein PQX77_020838 [Marasmius sp. AFHP31]|nr:hypothetical protein PQX77_020838 [Marasmius sp. AFHP31]